MRKTPLCAAILTILSSACGHAAISPDVAAPAVPAKATVVAAETTKAAASDSPPAAPGPAWQQAGDFVVYRFSGTYRDRPAKLTQKIVGRRGTTVLVDVVLEDGSETEHLRIRSSDAPETRGRILSVARMDGGVERPYGVAAYEELMARTAPAVEDNEGQIGSEPATIKVGTAAVACTRTSYRVRMSGSAATMTTCASPKFAWGDVSGEIAGADGTVLYRAEIVELGRAPAGSVAQAPDDEQIYEGD
ncbi:MAG: hypothetical protein HY744_28555 [Deltaproteobacteria bacterium]|nr:hypothetical protein [Deltaproteobacteria bacterium]